MANIAIDLYGMTAVLSRVSSNTIPNRSPEVLAHEKDLARLVFKVCVRVCVCLDACPQIVEQH